MPVTQDDFPDIPKVTPVSPPFTANALTPTGMVEFAVALKVPCSGIPELDDMIRESRRLDMATAAMVALIGARTPNGFGSGWPTHVERDAVLLADALLAASGKESGK